MVVAANDNAEDDAKQCVARFFLSRPLQFYYEYIFGCRFIRWDIWEIKTEAQRNAALTCEWNVIEPAHVQCEKWIWEREEKAKNRSKKNTFGSIEGWKQMNNNYGIRTKKAILIHSMEQQQQLKKLALSSNGTPGAHLCFFIPIFSSLFSLFVFASTFARMKFSLSGYANVLCSYFITSKRESDWILAGHKKSVRVREKENEMKQLANNGE